MPKNLFKRQENLSERPIRDLAEAHYLMRLHVDCHLGHCVRKRSAFRMLYAAGHLVPDVRSQRYVLDDGRWGAAQDKYADIPLQQVQETDEGASWRTV